MFLVCFLSSDLAYTDSTRGAAKRIGRIFEFFGEFGKKIDKNTNNKKYYILRRIGKRYSRANNYHASECMYTFI
jgi:hypothetical protein